MLGESEQNLNLLKQSSESIDYLEEEILKLKLTLSTALNIPFEEIKTSFPLLKNFYYVNNVFKSSWAIYLNTDGSPKLLYTGNFLIQGDKFGNRSSKSLFGLDSLSSLTSLANTFSTQASFFKQNWTLDLDIFENDESKLKITRKEYQDFLSSLNNIRARCLLHLCEEGNFDFAISEFSEPSDPLFFIDLSSIESSATKTKTFFKPISERAISIFKGLSKNTEFEGKFSNFQPGSWIRDDVLFELQQFSASRGEDVNEPLIISEVIQDTPFRIQAIRS
jgi:hypothetical protein